MSNRLLSLQDLVAWLETKPTDDKYWYMNPCNCLFHRYLKARGLPVETVGPRNWFDDTGGRHAIPTDVRDVFSAWLPKTYGFALSRARAALAEQQVPPVASER